MGKEAVGILIFLLAIFIISLAVAVEEHEIAGGEEEPVVEVAPQENIPSLCSIASPVSEAAYNSRRVLLEVYSNKSLASIKYKDSSDSETGWRTLCSSCKEYKDEKSFNEGWHNLSIRCRDFKGNEGIHELEFLNDYTNPRISRMSPSSGVTNGSGFSVKYSEDNLDSILLRIRNISASSSNEPKVELFVMALCPYSLQAENGLLSVMGLLEDNADIRIRFVHFMLHGEEEQKETYRQLCIREEQPDKYMEYLSCFVKSGDYDSCLDASDVDIRELEECFFNRAEGYYAEDSNLSEAYGVQGSPTIVINGEMVNNSKWKRSPASILNRVCSAFSKVPKECFECLSNENPPPGFGFSDYDAFNCEDGEEEEGWIEKACPSGKNQACSFDVDLSEYEGQEIEYFFVARDLAGNLDISRPVKVEVDTTAPVLNNPSSFWEQGSGREERYIYFNLNVTEENLEKISYSYKDSRGRLRKGILCSSLRDGFCTKKKSFVSGDYELTIEILDEAGNSLKEEIEFTVA